MSRSTQPRIPRTAVAIRLLATLTLATLLGGCLCHLCKPDHPPAPSEEGGDATLVQYPIGGRVIPEEGGPGDDAFLDFYKDQFVLPRAWPAARIDTQKRIQAHRALGEMRRDLGLPHRPAGWRDHPGAPGTTGPGGCAWSSAGPTNINGRITDIAIDPMDRDRIFATSVGGIWRSSDGGRRWQRVSDDFLATVFGSVAIHPASSNEVLAGGGDPNYHGAGGGSGLGIWRSPSGGDPGTWTKTSPAALDGRVIYRLLYDPDPPYDVYAATSAGVYVGTHSGTGISWSPLDGFDAFANDLAVDFSSTPPTVYVGVRQPSTTFQRGIWKHDGTGWHKRDGGIPTGSGRTIALALAASSPSTLYAKIENGTNGRLLGVYKTTTGGEPPSGGGNAWTSLPAASVMDDSIFGGGSGYSWYNSVLAVDPNDPQTVYGGGLRLYRTTTGGTSWSNISGGADATRPFSIHADQHAVAFDPVDSNIVYVGNDGGIDRTTDLSNPVWRWTDRSHGMVLTEFYRLTSQQALATVVAGGSQDNGTEISFGNRTWYNPGGCDGAHVAIDGQTSSTLYANCNGTLYELVNPVPGTPGGGSTISWTPPPSYRVRPPVTTDSAMVGAALAAGEPVPPATGGQKLLKTTDGMSWTAASPALPAGATIRFIAIAPSSGFSTYYVGVLAAGGPQIWRTTVGGGTGTSAWSTTSTGLPSLSPNGGAVDWTDPQRAFLALGGGGGGAGGVALTTNGGAHWDLLPGAGSHALPATPVLDVAIDPNDSNVVYAATNIGVFRGVVTPGATPHAQWTPFDEGLPDGLDVNDLSMNRSAGILRLGSMGHGSYLRDIRPGITCPGAMLTVRDNVVDRGVTPSPSGVPDPEHPVPDPARPGFYKPDDSSAGRLYWWTSSDIRVDVPALDPPKNSIDPADHVEVESCPVEISSCPTGTLLDSDPRQGDTARVYVQVTNRGLAPASNVKVTALFADASTGLPLLPVDFWTTTFPAGTSGCGALDTASGWQFADPASPCKVIPVVNPDLPEVARFEWTVPASAAQHSCMLAVVESLDDPLDSSVRGSNERELWVLVPQNRQIGLRNLHIVPMGSAPHRETLVLRNPGRGESVDLVISRAGLPPGVELSLVLPAALGGETRGVEPVDAGAQIPATGGWTVANAETRDRTDDRWQGWAVVEDDAALYGLPIPPGGTVRVGLVFDDPDRVIAPGTAARLTILQRDGQTVIGGSTYVLRRASPR